MDMDQILSALEILNQALIELNDRRNTIDLENF